MKVWTIPHTLFAAKHLVNQVNKLGINCELVDRIDDDGDIFIIYGALNCPVLPQNYIVYQTEIAGTHFFSKRYLAIIKYAIAVWEYSSFNLPAYKHMNPNRSIITPGIDLQPYVHKDIPVLFYGWTESSDRRKRILNQLSKHIEIRIVTNSIGTEMWDLLSRSKIVLNLHFYDFSPLEVFRINEALSHRCMVVSEKPADRYYNRVYFGDSVDMLLLQLQRCLCDPWRMFNEDLSVFDNLFEVKSALSVIRRVKPEAFRVHG